MSLIELINNFRTEHPHPSMREVDPEFSLKYGSKWLSDELRHAPATSRHWQITRWTDQDGRSMSAWSRNGRRQEIAVRNIGLEIRDRIVASNYLRSNSRVARFTHEFKEVSNECVLVKRIVTVWKFPQNEGGSWRRVTTQNIRDAMDQDIWKVEEHTFAVIIPETLHPRQDDPEMVLQGENPNPTTQTIHGMSHLWFGHLNSDGASKSPVARLIVRQGNKTTTSQAYSRQDEDEEKLIVIEELRGLSAMAWLNPDCTEQQVRSMLTVKDSNTREVYELPSIKRKKKICEHWNDENETSLGELVFSKLNDNYFPGGGNNLLELYVNIDAEIICYIGNKTSIAHIMGDDRISVNLPKGTYAIRRNDWDVDDSYSRRRHAVIEQLVYYQVTMSVDRMDILSTSDIVEHSIIEKDLTGRIQSGEVSHAISSGERNNYDNVFSKRLNL